MRPGPVGDSASTTQLGVGPDGGRCLLCVLRGITLVLKESHLCCVTALVGLSRKVSGHRDLRVQIFFITTRVQLKGVFKAGVSKGRVGGKRWPAAWPWGVTFSRKEPCPFIYTAAPFELQ